MKVQYQMSEDDFVAAVALGKRSQLRLFLLIQIIGGIMVAFAVLSVVLGRAQLVLGPGLIVPALMLSFPFLIAYQSRRIFRNSSAIREPRTLVVDETGLRFDSISASGHVAWSNYVSFVEDERSFALRQQGKQIFVPIPKRQMTPLQVEEMSSLFKIHIGGK